MGGSSLDYYDNKENVENYVQMADGYDGQLLIDLLRKHLSDNASVLELGMGPGTDLCLLDQHFNVTGSDRSMVFLDRFRRHYPTADIMQLDAVTMNTGRKFDAIYSNKVLHHLTRQQLQTSFQLQATILNTDGILCHSFWRGDKEAFYRGLRFVYYTQDSIKDLLGDNYEIIEFQCYAELEKNDSFCLILRKNA